MTYPISEIDGLPSFAASKLKSLGIRTTDRLLEAARDVKGRKALAAKTGISEQQLLEWANFSDYMRIPGMVGRRCGWCAPPAWLLFANSRFEIRRGWRRT